MRIKFISIQLKIVSEFREKQFIPEFDTCSKLSFRFANIMNGC